MSQYETDPFDQADEVMYRQRQKIAKLEAENSRLISHIAELLQACKAALGHAQLLGSGQDSPYSNAEICEIVGSAINRAEKE